MEFFAFFYRLAFYGDPLFHHLHGWSDEANGYVAQSDRFPLIFSVTLGVCFLAFILYYFIIDHPRANRWYFWLIPLGVVLLTGFGLAFGIVRTDMESGVIAESLSNDIGMGNAILFGVYNGLLGGIFFLLLSALFRFPSRNSKHSPWPLLVTKLNNKGRKNYE